jgi:DNA-binding GntR family transcriptional regulator
LKQPVPFKKTNRFIRGRIIDALRQKRRKEQRFIAFLMKEFGRSEEEVRHALAGLTRDGLIEVDRGIVRLAGSA